MKKLTKTMQSRPTLVYDGQCGFCAYWAHYWQKLTGDRVQYKPFQEVANQYPEISLEEFQQAVQYITPEGAIASAAEASFLTLSNAPGKSFWLSLYRKLPGFAWICEKVYAFIAAHRTIFYYISIAFWGRDYEPPSYNLVAWLFLRLFGLIYLIAFFSFSTQALGLIGNQGIIPVSELVAAARDQLGAIGYWLFPMVFWFNTSDLFVQVCCWGGMLFSLLLIFNILPRISLLSLYVLYLSLICAGQAFMSFQWDLFALETGVLAFFLMRPWVLGIWLMRWLLFRFFLAAGLVKIFSGDPTWQGFTTLHYYFLTQPLPTPLAWYAHYLPTNLLKMATFVTLIIELVIPFFIFLPRYLRFFAAYAFLFLQIIISLTGNYNFFNLLTMLLCLTLFDDAALASIFPKRMAQRLLQRPSKKPYKIIYVLVGIFAATTVFFSMVQFDLRFASRPPASMIWIYNKFDIISPLRIVNVYGPFAIITTDRLEIIIEGSDDEVNWQEYIFKYKPGNVNRRPLWNIPLQPRLDWQMWFAALSTPENNVWFLRLMRRLAENSAPVIELLEHNPFPDKPPRYLRAQFYDYRFTTPEERAKNGVWWDRRLVRLYFP